MRALRQRGKVGVLVLLLATTTFALLQSWHYHDEWWQKDVAVSAAEHQHCFLCHAPIAVAVEPSSAVEPIEVVGFVPLVRTDEGTHSADHHPATLRGPPTASMRA